MWDDLLDYFLHDYLLLYDYLLLNDYLTIEIHYLLDRNFFLYYFLDDFFSLDEDFCWKLKGKEDFLDHYHLFLNLDRDLYDYFFLRVPLDRILVIFNSLANRSMSLPDISCALLLLQAFLTLQRFFLYMCKICKGRVPVRMLMKIILTLTNLTSLIDILDHFLLYNNFLYHFFYDFLLYVYRHFNDFFDPLLSRILTTRYRLIILIDVTGLEALTISKLEVALLGI